jgi:hypothetical protein
VNRSGFGKTIEFSFQSIRHTLSSFAISEELEKLELGLNESDSRQDSVEAALVSVLSGLGSECSNWIAVAFNAASKCETSSTKSKADDVLSVMYDSSAFKIVCS